MPIRAAVPPHHGRRSSSCPVATLSSGCIGDIHALHIASPHQLRPRTCTTASVVTACRMAYTVLAQKLVVHHGVEVPVGFGRLRAPGTLPVRPLM
jgi:hypothetical protein